MMTRFVLLLSVAFLLAACAPHMAQQKERSTQFPQTMYVDWVRVYKPD